MLPGMKSDEHIPWGGGDTPERSVQTQDLEWLEHLVIVEAVSPNVHVVFWRRCGVLGLRSFSVGSGGTSGRWCRVRRGERCIICRWSSRSLLTGLRGPLCAVAGEVWQGRRHSSVLGRLGGLGCVNWRRILCRGGALVSSVWWVVQAVERRTTVMQHIRGEIALGGRLGRREGGLVACAQRTSLRGREQLQTAI